MPFSKDFKDYLPTINNMGYMATKLDPYCQEFIEFAKTCTLPIVDLGVAFGNTTKQLLKTGVTVYANDLDSRHLEILHNSVPEDQRDRLILTPGRLPEEVNFEDGSIGAVLASRCLMFLSGNEIEESVEKFYHWLPKGGKAFVTVETPYLTQVDHEGLEGFIPIYEERKAKGDPWPGLIKDWKLYSDQVNMPNSINLLDPDILRRTFEKANFTVEKVGFFSRNANDTKVSRKDAAGIIGIKN